MKKKLKFILPIVLLLLVGASYKFAFAKSTSGPPPKVDGVVYVMPKEFLVNLADGRFAKVSVALLLDHTQIVGAAGAEGGAPPEGFGPLEQEAVVRDIVTNELTGDRASDLIRRKGRDALKARILRAIKRQTDVKAKEVLFTDVAVQ
jgi:flagellar FliL protein